MSYLDIRNQVANYRLKFSSCNIKKGTCNLLKDNKSKEATSKVFIDLKAWVSRGYQGTSKLPLAF